MFAHILKLRCLSAAVGVSLCGAALAEGTTIESRESAAFLAPTDSTDHRQYAPDREIDVLHLALDVTPDFSRRTVAGEAMIRFKPIARPLHELKLDAVDLKVDSVTSTAKIQAYQVTRDHLIVTFSDPIAPGTETSVTIRYSAQPQKGLYFRTPEMGYQAGDAHLFSQGESTEARHWFPCYDSPNEKFTTEITCRVPEGITVLSNGRKVSEEKDPTTGLIAVHWLQDKPHVNYLISLVAGHFKKVEDKYRDIPIAFWTPASEIDQSMTSFRDTKDMMAFFEQDIGVAYPWAKYDQVCVDDYGWGGMENTSITTLNASTLFTDASENIRTSEGLMSHEMAHQWFGDLVTCKDWSHIWLNEGFATYYASLYTGHKHGRDDLLHEMYQRAKALTANPDDPKPMVSRKFDTPEDMFVRYGHLSYDKGGWVLHMLRSQLGDELFQRCIKTYLERHQYDNVVTEDLRAVIEELSGRSYDQFFDQWVYHGGCPNLDVAYNWDERTKLARVSIKQNQKVSDDVPLFNFPLTIRFKTKSGAVDRKIVVKDKEEDFYFALAEAPESVRIDPELAVLAKISFNVPNAMLYTQLADQQDVVGRLIAVEQLARRKDHESVAKLKGALNGDPFYGVRLEASRALRSIHTDEALESLLASTQQSDARVRQQVVDDIAGFYGDTAYSDAIRVLNSEKNPEILAKAIRSLAGYSKAEVRETLLKYLNSDSYHNALADAAIEGIRLQDDPAYIAPLTDTLSKREAAFTTESFGRGLNALAYLTRNEESKDAVRQFLTGYVNHKRQSVQLAAIGALATLGDPKAISLLNKFATAMQDSPVRSAAERAVASLRAARKPVDDFKNLRSEVLDLEKQNRELSKALDDLKTKIEATAPPPTVEAKKKKKSGSAQPP